MTIADRIAGLDWAALAEEMAATGFAQPPAVLPGTECGRLPAACDDDERFRSPIDMRRSRLGEGAYRYLDSPLPELIDQARNALYAPLAELANRWAAQLGETGDFPADLEAFLRRCHRAGQRRTTPLILRYSAGGHNTLHQDLYGDVAFPLQAVTMLSAPGTDFEGGQFGLLEQRPRAPSRAHAIGLEPGAVLPFSTRHRPGNRT